WAAGIPQDKFSAWVVMPNRKVVSLVRQAKPDAKIIGFPRAATETGYSEYAAETGVDAVGIDTATWLGWARSGIGKKVALQGNLDPIALIAGGATLDSAVDRILNDVASVSFIFNLGHGVLPETPPEHVGRVVERIRKGSR